MREMGVRLSGEGDEAEFRVFAHRKKEVSLVIKTSQGEKEYPMKAEEPHVYSLKLEGIKEGTLYKYHIDAEGPFPDPYTHYQPQGVHGFSQVMHQNLYSWQDQGWKGLAQEDLILMEIHVGTFSTRGDFAGVTEKLDHLVELGITAVELMPVIQTPGRWNWGYDGANLFSVNCNYGTPEDLKALVDACHQRGMAVILDVVYNHFGPEGNYLPMYGPYLTEKHKTPWGEAVNYDDSFSEFTRRMVLDNIRYWIKDYHLDGFRLDAVHAIEDYSETHILQEIKDETEKLSKELGRSIFVIAESDENDVKLITPPKKGGFGLDAVWMDDFHHSLHTVLTAEKQGYYIDYGPIENLESVYKNFLYTGQHSRFWKKPRGTDAALYPGRQFVVAIQNHDQVGNRATGDRLTTLVDFAYLKAAAGLLFFAPYIPLLFMGEEYGEENPFLFFSDYGDEELKKGVSEGRRKEFADFDWDEVPDPQDPATFYRSRLTPSSEWQEKNRHLFTFYKDLIRLRREHPVLKNLDKFNVESKTEPAKKLVEILRWNQGKKLTGLFNLGSEDVEIQESPSKELLSSARAEYGGPGHKRGILQKGEALIIEARL